MQGSQVEGRDSVIEWLKGALVKAETLEPSRHYKEWQHAIRKVMSEEKLWKADMQRSVRTPVLTCSWYAHDQVATSAHAGPCKAFHTCVYGVGVHAALQIFSRAQETRRTAASSHRSGIGGELHGGQARSCRTASSFQCRPQLLTARRHQSTIV